MAKLTLNDIPSGFFSATAYNTNNGLIETALENTLSRDGTTPNTMGANLDMNSNRITNLPIPLNANEPARLVDVQDAISGNSTATLTTFSPAGNIAATNVQAAIVELDAEKAKLAGDATQNFSAALHVASRSEIRHGSAPVQKFYNTGAAADKKQADFAYSGGSFLGRFVNDAETLTKNWVEVVGNYVDGAVSVTFSGLLKPSNGVQASGNMALSVATDHVRLVGTGSGAAAVGLVDASRTANNRFHDMVWTGGGFSCQFVNDTYGAATQWLTVNGGYAAGTTSVNITAPTINLAGIVAINTVPSAAWGLDFAPNSTNGNYITIADNGTYDLASGSGLLILHSANTAASALFMTEGGFTTEVFDRSGNYTTVLDTAGKINVYYNGGTNKYRIQNKTGGSASLWVTAIRTRTLP